MGTVDGKDEQDVRHAALSKFDIPADADFANCSTYRTFLYTVSIPGGLVGL